MRHRPTTPRPAPEPTRTLASAEDFAWDTLLAVARDGAGLALGEAVLPRVAAGQHAFASLIASGVPCYGLTTGLGRLVEQPIDPRHVDAPAALFRARAAASGPPLPVLAARATLAIRLADLLRGREGVRPALCEFLVARLNDGLTPWIPSLGHGIAGDVTAHAHAFQILAGEGFVLQADGTRRPAAEALAARGAAPFALTRKEALALLNGLAATPALGLWAWLRLGRTLQLANLVAAAAVEGLAAPRDPFDPALDDLYPEPGARAVSRAIRGHLAGSAIVPHRLQAPVSYRVVAQVHGALHDALAALRARVECALGAPSGNPLLIPAAAGKPARLLSVGSFHTQHLANQAEQVALALAQVGVSSERRLHRLLDPQASGLNAQLAPRAGLDAGLVTVHKASLDLSARLRALAAPVSLATGESSGGQEDFMSLAIPALLRLEDMARLVERMLAAELHAALVALDQRGVASGAGVAAVHLRARRVVAPLERDRAPGHDLEQLCELFRDDAFQRAFLNENPP